jgi:hypothetical protein
VKGRTFSIGQWVTILLALPGGFLLGVMTGILQACSFKVGTVPIQWGLVAALFLIWIAIRLPSYDVGTRWVGVLVSLGWVIATVMLAIQTPAGDQVLVGDTSSMVYIALGSVCVGIAAAWPLIRKQDAGGAALEGAPVDGDTPDAIDATGVEAEPVAVGGVAVAPPAPEPNPYHE